jgi:hypothetical protein
MIARPDTDPACLRLPHTHRHARGGWHFAWQATTLVLIGPAARSAAGRAARLRRGATDLRRIALVRETIGHYRGDFRNRVMYTPLLRRPCRCWLPAIDYPQAH